MLMIISFHLSSLRKSQPLNALSAVVSVDSHVADDGKNIECAVDAEKDKSHVGVLGVSKSLHGCQINTWISPS